MTETDWYQLGAICAQVADRRAEGEDVFPLWRAAKHQWGAGKVHVCDSEEHDRTLCGRNLEVTPGRPDIGSLDDVTCGGCQISHKSRIQQQQRRDEWEQRREELARQREEENRAWWDWYTDYLRSPEWHERRRRVLQRDSGVCQGCLTRQATQVHHLTYDHAGSELLYELVSICDECHDQTHSREIRSKSVFD